MSSSHRRCCLFLTSSSLVPGDVGNHEVVLEDKMGANPPTFKAISVNQHCVTIQSTTGFRFDGSLNHAGARVNYNGCPESEIISDVELVVRHTGGSTKSATDYEQIFNRLCLIENVSSVSRLHLLLFPKGKNVSQNANSVGREGCPLNAEFH
jgi:hypothetical protein